MWLSSGDVRYLLSIYSAESAELSALKGLRCRVVSFLTAPSVGRPRPSSAVLSLGPDAARAPAGEGRAGHFTVCAQQMGESRLICTGGASGAHQTLALRSAFGAPRLQWLLRDPATSKCHFFFYELFLALRLQLSSSLLSFQSRYKFQVVHLFCRVNSLTPTDRSVKHFLLHMYDRSPYTEKKKICAFSSTNCQQAR